MNWNCRSWWKNVWQSETIVNPAEALTLTLTQWETAMKPTETHDHRKLKWHPEKLSRPELNNEMERNFNRNQTAETEMDWSEALAGRNGDETADHDMKCMVKLSQSETGSESLRKLSHSESEMIWKENLRVMQKLAVNHSEYFHTQEMKWKENLTVRNGNQTAETEMNWSEAISQQETEMKNSPVKGPSRSAKTPWQWRTDRARPAAQTAKGHLMKWLETSSKPCFCLPFWSANCQPLGPSEFIVYIYIYTDIGYI